MSEKLGEGVDRRNFLQSIAAVGAASGDVRSETTADVAAQTAKTPADDASTADIIVDNLLEWDVSHVFGMVGDGINPIIDALRRRKDRIRFVGVRHEEAAAFKACGWAKHTGRLGVCLATTGPG